MAELIPFKQRLKEILWGRGISIYKFCEDTGIERTCFFYRKTRCSGKHRPHVYMAIAYYLDMKVEELVEGTDAEDELYC